MKVTPAIVLTDAMVTSSVAETDADDGPLWVAGVYAAGAKVRRPNHHSYEAAVAIDGSVTEPENNTETTPPKWIDLGYTNKWRMLSLDSDQQTESTGSIVLTVTPGQRATAVAAVFLEADSIQVTTSDGWDSGVRSLRTRNTRSWSGWFLGKFHYRRSTIFFNLPPSSTAVVTITITKAAGAVKCGPVVIGTPVELGKAVEGVEKGQRDYSSITADDNFGTRGKLRKRKAIALLRPAAKIDNPFVIDADRVLTEQRATVAFYTVYDDPSHPRFDLMSLLGLCTDFTIKEGSRRADLTLNLEGY